MEEGGTELWWLSPAKKARDLRHLAGHINRQIEEFIRMLKSD